jgi:Zn-dependent M28 family amino/carboxypeptidase
MVAVLFCQKEDTMPKSLKFVTIAALAALLLPTTHAFADGNEIRLSSAVKLKALKKHLSELQLIATRNVGTRAAGTPGHAASAGYIAAQLKSVGYKVQMLPFKFSVFSEVSPPSFSQTAPGAVTYVEDTDFNTQEYSGSGQVNAQVQAAGGLVLPPTPDPSSASGCDAADFAGFVAGRVALIQRGGCTFATKATNAFDAGASAAIIFNEGNANDPSRVGLFGGTLGEDFNKPIPVISVPFALGETLAGLAGATVSIRTDTKTEVKETVNVVAETQSGRSDKVIVVGAHLDSVPVGPGINDNGSGSAAILEVAKQLKKFETRNKVRFMWYSAEEAGLVGSQNYVDSLTDAELGNIALMLNFDMVASPNFVRFVYDGDGSDTATAGPYGSAEIERVFATYFKKRSLAFEPTAFDGRSDYGPFIDIGIPAGGLFTGAEVSKTPEQVAIYGGTAGVAYDACYHKACDDIGNINDQVFGEMASAIARVVEHFGMAKTPIAPAPVASARLAKAASSKALLFKGPHLQQ